MDWQTDHNMLHNLVISFLCACLGCVCMCVCVCICMYVHRCTCSHICLQRPGKRLNVFFYYSSPYFWKALSVCLKLAILIRMSDQQTLGAHLPLHPYLPLLGPLACVILVGFLCDFWRLELRFYCSHNKCSSYWLSHLASLGPVTWHLEIYC